ncbi:MAG: hypothetical protein CVU73_09810 [Deltaproteobacteria bacterium HGW-Deltaproteobacteria-8]|jgi:MtN3 and saliva related transmembrane protein|nr:MAG: hypothetical protein CVU73_09810 [Deltaproteobacteria bacterium HGW-Deltaproteobacteria-8]
MILDITLNWVEYLGLAAGTLTTAAYLPQVWKTWRTKAVGDISLFMYLSMCLGVLLWLVYGILIKAPAVIAANSAALLLVGGMLRMKVKYGRLAKAAAAGSKTPTDQTSSGQAAPNQESGQTSNQPSGQPSDQASGPSLAAQLGRSLRQLKPYASRFREHQHKTWGKD